jgi:hypothetical protein
MSVRRIYKLVKQVKHWQYMTLAMKRAAVRYLLHSFPLELGYYE